MDFLSERVPVEKVRRIAKKNGISKELVDRSALTAIPIPNWGGHGREVKDDKGKCTSLLYMRKTDVGIEYCRSVESVVYVPEQTIEGLDVYPLVGMRWEERVGDARGVGGVEYLIPNQLEENKTAARRAIAVKRFSFPTFGLRSAEGRQC
jgi:hypothetical protein